MSVDRKKFPKGKAFKGRTCKHDGNCGSLKCGYPGDASLHKICCPLGTYSAWHNYCRNLPAGFYCQNDSSGKNGCNNRACGNPAGDKKAHHICCFSGKTISKGGRTYCLEFGESPCTAGFQCISGNCSQGICKGSDGPGSGGGGSGGGGSGGSGSSGSGSGGGGSGGGGSGNRDPQLKPSKNKNIYIIIGVIVFIIILGLVAFFVFKSKKSK